MYQQPLSQPPQQLWRQSPPPWQPQHSQQFYTDQTQVQLNYYWQPLPPSGPPKKPWYRTQLSCAAIIGILFVRACPSVAAGRSARNHNAGGQMSSTATQAHLTLSSPT